MSIGVCGSIDCTTRMIGLTTNRARRIEDGAGVADAVERNAPSLVAAIRYSRLSMVGSVKEEEGKSVQSDVERRRRWTRRIYVPHIKRRRNA
jgi:hypothetical protein